MALNGSSYRPSLSETAKPPRRNDVDSFVLLLLAFAFVLAIIFIPGVRVQLGSFFAEAANSRMNSSVVVWANKGAGSYYCAGSRLYGKAPGSYMKQGAALTAGYQPCFGKYCKELHQTDSKRLKPIPNRSSQSASFSSDRPASVFPPTK